MLYDREDIQNILLEEGRAIFVFKIVLSQQNLYSSFDAKSTHQRDLLQVEVVNGGVQRLGRGALPVEVALEVGLYLLPEGFGRQRGPLDLRLLDTVVSALSFVATFRCFTL